MFLGWDKQSYGYHGDDGNSFSSSGHGQSYGPTFTTGDIIGCCVNFVDNTCFYTKNGIDLGIAFRDLPVSWKKRKIKKIIYIQRILKTILLKVCPEADNFSNRKVVMFQTTFL